MATPQPQDLQGLQLEVDGVTRSWADWTSHYVDSYYPRVGQDCYRVPAVHFNQQKLTKKDTRSGHTFHVQHSPVKATMYARAHLCICVVGGGGGGGGGVRVCAYARDFLFFFFFFFFFFLLLLLFLFCKHTLPLVLTSLYMVSSFKEVIFFLLSFPLV